MNNLCGPQTVPPNQKSAKHVIIIKVLMVFQFLIAVMDLVAHAEFLRQGIFGLFFLMLLFSSYYKLSHGSLLIYTFSSLFFMVIFLDYILKIVQNGRTLADLSSPWSQYHLATACISFVFYLFTSIYCFYPYRQFKSIEYSENPAFSSIMMNSADTKNPEEMQDVKFAIDYGKKQPERDNNYQGTYQVFKGQGIRIG